MKDPRPRAQWVSIPSILCGLFLLLASLNVIPIPPESLRAPRWILGAVALLFCIAGVMLLVPREHRRLQNFLGALIMTGMSAILSWGAFGPGERQFESSLSVGGFVFSSVPSEWAGRAVLGCCSILMDSAAVWAWIHWVRNK